jgi:hypothetical protein
VALRPTIEGGGRITAVSSAAPGFFKIWCPRSTRDDRRPGPWTAAAAPAGCPRPQLAHGVAAAARAQCRTPATPSRREPGSARQARRRQPGRHLPAGEWPAA